MRVQRVSFGTEAGGLCGHVAGIGILCRTAIAREDDRLLPGADLGSLREEFCLGYRERISSLTLADLLDRN